MTTTFDSFDEGPVGEFEESPLDARNRGPDHVLAMIFIDKACSGGQTNDPDRSGYLDQFCVETSGNTSVFDADRFAFRTMRQRDYSEDLRQLRAGLLHVPMRSVQTGLLSHKPVVPSARFPSTFEGASPDLHYMKATERPAELAAAVQLFMILESSLNVEQGEQITVYLIVFHTSVHKDLVDPMLTTQFIPWLRAHGITDIQRSNFGHRWWLREATSVLAIT